MSQILSCEFRINKPNRRYHISYNSASSTSSTRQISPISQIFLEWTKSTTQSQIQFQLKSAQNHLESVAKVSFDNFEVDLTKMDMGKYYQITYDDSIYEILKNEKRELEVSEIG